MKEVVIDSREYLAKSVEDIMNVQLTNGNWNYDPYMQGMANGMILIYSLILDVDCGHDFLHAPDEWIKDKKSKEVPISEPVREYK